MREFAKQPNCPATVVLAAFNDDALSVLARQSVAAHLSACEFCAAEAQLLAQATPARSAAQDAPALASHDASSSATQDAWACAPPVPLALRLLAQTLLAGVAAADAQRAA
jgi:hypothetical protein